MPRIESVPPSDIDPELWQRVLEHADKGLAFVELEGLLAYHGELFRQRVESLGANRFGTLLGPRLSELVRLRSSQLGGCVLCQDVRYGDAVADEEVACMPLDANQKFTPREAAALEFTRLMHVDHFSIDDSVYRMLNEHFTVAEIMELGSMLAHHLGQHRFMCTLDLYGTGKPAIAYRPDQVYAGETSTIR